MSELQERLQAAVADRYRIELEIGRGGMATVFLAQDPKHGRPVALKVLHPLLAAALGPERFLREIQIAARLQPPTSSRCTTPARRTHSARVDTVGTALASSDLLSLAAATASAAAAGRHPPGVIAPTGRAGP